MKKEYINLKHAIQTGKEAFDFCGEMKLLESIDFNEHIRVAVYQFMRQELEGTTLMSFFEATEIRDYFDKQITCAKGLHKESPICDLVDVIQYKIAELIWTIFKDKNLTVDQFKLLRKITKE